MSSSTLVASAAAAVLALGLAGPAHADDSGKEKCYGIAKAGQNDCANLGGTHSCAGQAKGDLEPREWKYVPKGSCKQMKGLSAAEAKQALKSS